MSPMRRVAEAAHRVPEVQDTNVEETPREPPSINVTDQWSEERDFIPESSQPLEVNLPSSVEQQESVREDVVWEPEIVTEHIPLLNGGPPVSWEETRTNITNTVATTTFTPTTGTVPTEFVSLSSTPQVSSTSIKEGIPHDGPICLTEEDPQITCSICNTIDCMIHNPRHRYCMDCGQRMMGSHVCPNEIEHSNFSRTQHPARMNRAQLVESEERRTSLPEVLLPLSDRLDMETFEEMVANHVHMLTTNSVNRPIHHPQLYLEHIMLIYPHMMKQLPQTMACLQELELPRVGRICYVI